MYSVFGPEHPDANILYATKPSPVALAIDAAFDGSTFGMIGRYGLPSPADALWIRDFVGERELVFLGDMDPSDLMIFAWLRANLAPARVTHLGVSDKYIADLKVVLPESFTLDLSPSERQSLPLLNAVFGDLTEIVGPKCADLLEQGRKIELDAIVSSKPRTASLLPPTILNP
jgi:hypothetical protein